MLSARAHDFRISKPELLAAVFAALNGPRKHKISDFKHFRDDPSTMIQFMMENPHQIESLTERMAAFENMASSFMHQMLLEPSPGL